uniref:Leucoanthocyanidin dioxygenase n=1 Tax=Pohlia nutans TaxID=140635 RepID=A0A4P8JIS8_9BRYO|nr:leucoanthocyanidin dioxygenase [Pohlia nutans]
MPSEVRAVQELVKDGHMNAVPEDYILPEEERPKLADGVSADHALPVIDMKGVEGERRGFIVEQIREACAQWGFFQVTNHGVPLPLIARMQQVSREFFELPLEDKMKYRSPNEEQMLVSEGYGTKVAAKKGAFANWGDQLRHKSLPASQRNYDRWPTNPSSFREIEEGYIEEQDKLVKRILELISESLGLESSYLNDHLVGKLTQTLLMNYYPHCPQPELVLGVQRHSDFGLLTLLVQDVDDAPGLQVTKDGDWITVMPMDGAVIVNLGDQMEMLSNGKYKSIEHRAFVTGSKPRMSIVAFTYPTDETVVGPISDLLSAEELPKYGRCSFGEYRSSFIASSGAHGKSHIQSMAIV